MGRILALALTAAATFVIGGVAEARNVTAKDPSSVVGAMKKAGYPAELTKDDAGDPMINSRAEGTDFNVHFYGCEENRNCKRIQFLYTISDPQNGSMKTLNDWNAENYFGRAYRNEEGITRLEMDVDLDDGGMSDALFVDNIEWWASIMDDFSTLMRKDGSADDQADHEGHDHAT